MENGSVKDLRKSFWRYLTITGGGTFVVVVAACALNFWAFSYIPRLNVLLSVNSAFFAEGILALISGLSIFLGAKPPIEAEKCFLFLGASYSVDNKISKDTAAFGLALIVACIILLLLCAW